MTVVIAQSLLDLGQESLREMLTHTLAMLLRWVADGWARAPALMAGLAALVTMPFLAAAGFFTNRYLTARRLSQPEPEPMRTERALAQGLAWPSHGWITIEGARPIRRELPREILSIGREDDNDLQLDDATVHRHHALLQRTPEAQFVIRDLSGQAGNGVTVNGQRIEQVILRHGDRIGIGVIELRFESEPG